MMNDGTSVAHHFFKLADDFYLVTLRSERDGERCAGQVEFAPSRFGIQPYRAFLGALKLDDRVRVSWDLRVISA